MHSSETIIDHSRRVKRVMIHIGRNIGREIRLDQLADVACYSTFHFIRVFEALMGETPQQFTIRKRMEHAGLYLLEKEQQIIDRAFDVGYETHNAFCKTFKNFYGMSLGRFRDTVSRKWFFKANRFYHPVNQAQTQPGQCVVPVIRTLPKLTIMYIKNKGFLKGPLSESAQDSLNQLTKVITTNNLEKRVKAIVSVYPNRIFSLANDTAFRFKGAISVKQLQRRSLAPCS